MCVCDVCVRIVSRMPTRGYLILFSIIYTTLRLRNKLNSINRLAIIRLSECYLPPMVEITDKIMAMYVRRGIKMFIVNVRVHSIFSTSAIVTTILHVVTISDVLNIEFLN